MSSDPIQDAKFMPLRYAGQCRACGSPLSAGARAIYFRSSKTIACLQCVAPYAELETPSASILGLGSLRVEEVSDLAHASESAAIFAGSAGASADPGTRASED